MFAVELVEVWVVMGFSRWALSDIRDFGDLGLTIVPIRSAEKVSYYMGWSDRPVLGGLVPDPEERLDDCTKFDTITIINCGTRSLG